MNKEDISYEKMREFNLVVFGGPKDMFSQVEVEEIQKYMETGGSLFILLGEGGEAK